MDDETIPCIAILNKQKWHFFFSFTKSENRRVEQVLPARGRGCTSGREGGGSGERV
jgi:hypothetical protein